MKDHFAKKANLVALSFIALATVGTMTFANFAKPAEAAVTSSSTQVVNVTVPQLPLSVDIISPAGGTVTSSAKVTVTLVASGAGKIVLTDQHGHVLWTYNKTSPGRETLTAVVTLPGDPGTYTLTANMVDAVDPSITSQDNTTVVYEATFVAPAILPPNTGYVRFGDRAVPVNQLVSLVVYLVVMVGIIWLIIARRKKRSRKNFSN